MRWLELRVPPVGVVAGAALLMWVLARLIPAVHYPFPARTIVGLAIALLGVCITAAAVLQFRNARTTVNPMTPEAATTLVRAGLFAYTRNPMYLGFGLLLAGFAVYLANAVSALVLPAFVLYLTRFQIEPEERSMVEVFGPQYADYKRTVRRWI
jgi:protein-S-isoprenylcysteine O-methyltransferase Ste14